MNFVKLFAFAIFTTVFIIESNAQSELMLKNSNIERVSPEGKFWWWNNSAKNGADATFSIEDFDLRVNPLKSAVLSLIPVVLLKGALRLAFSTLLILGSKWIPPAIH